MTRVHDTDSATENYRPGSSGIRVKTQGKSLRLPAVMQVAGKPYMLKCHVYYVGTTYALASVVTVGGSFIKQQCFAEWVGSWILSVMKGQDK